jgi:hypothetical protein
LQAGRLRYRRNYGPPSRAFESATKTCCGFDHEFRPAAEVEQGFVAGHKNVSISGLCQKKERLVVRIAA